MRSTAAVAAKVTEACPRKSQGAATGRGISEAVCRAIATPEAPRVVSECGWVTLSGYSTEYS